MSRLTDTLKRRTEIDLRGSLRVAAGSAVVLRWGRGQANWGDALNPVLAEYISGKPNYPYQAIANFRNRRVYSVIGSILDSSAIRNQVVWGSGFMYRTGTFRIPPRAVHAIRGPLSREICLKQGIACPEIYGDPALLLPRFYQPEETPKYELGIVAHIVDADNPFLERLAVQPQVTVIDIRTEVHEFVNLLAQCRAIASSSLHGLIAADAYAIPSVWVQMSDRVLGDGFKFQDYFASIGRECTGPLIIERETTLSEITDHLAGPNIDIDLDALLDACPFLPTGD